MQYPGAGASGLEFMSDVYSQEGGLISWAEATRRGVPSGCESAFRALVANLKEAPEIDPGEVQHEFFLEDEHRRQVWQFHLPALRLS